MAKKPNESKGLVELIKSYLKELDILGETIENPNLEMGFRFGFPPGRDENGRLKGRPFTIVKAKDKDLIEISSQINISPEHVRILKKFGPEAKPKLFAKLSKLFNFKELMYNLDLKKNRFAVIDSFFIKERQIITKNTFYRIIRKIFGTVMVAIAMVNEFCSSEGSGNDLKLIID